MEVPHHRLSSSALRGLVEEFITREGTNYGKREYSLDEMVAQVLAQLERGEATIVYDSVTATTSVRRKE